MDIYRGDIYYIDWDDTALPVGSEQRPGRPGVIVSNDESNAKLNTVQVVYLTTKEKSSHPAHVSVICKVPSTALCEQLNTVDKCRLGDYVRTCTDREMAAIERGKMAALGISPVRDEKADRYQAALMKAEHKLAEMDAMNAELRDAVTTLKDREKNRGVGSLRLEIERDIYRMLYHNLLDRIGLSRNEVGA